MKIYHTSIFIIWFLILSITGALETPGKNSTDIYASEPEPDWDDSIASLSFSLLQDPGSNATLFEASLGRFLDRLKSYVRDGHFDFELFDADSEPLRHELLNLHKHLKSTNATLGIIQQLLYITHVFRVMRDSCKLMQRYRTLRFPSHRLLSKITEMNVRVLMLCNSFGELDRNLDFYTWEIRWLRDSLHFWGSRFGKVPYVQPSDWLVFRLQYLRVERALMLLAAQASEPLIQWF